MKPSSRWMPCLLTLIVIVAGHGPFAWTGEDATPRNSIGDCFSFASYPDGSSDDAPSVLWRSADGLLLARADVLRKWDDATSTWKNIGDGLGAIELPGGVTVASSGKRGVFRAGGALHEIEFVGGAPRVSTLAALPPEWRAVEAVAVDDKRYALARDEITNAGRFAILRTDAENAWSPLTAPGAPITEKATLVVATGVVHAFLPADAAGRLMAYRYRPDEDTWDELGLSPPGLAGARAFACGDAHILFLAADSPAIHAYYRTAKRWVVLGDVPAEAVGAVAAAGAKDFYLLSKTALTHGVAVLPPTKYGWLDHGIVALFFIAMLWIGKTVSKKEESENGYFRGGNKIPWWAAGLSMFATGASAISLMAMPAKAYTENWIYFSTGLFGLAMLPFSLLVILPIARRLRFTTAFEYLERRFNRKIRILGSLVFSLGQLIGRLATTMLLPSIALTSICGLSMETSIVIMGVVTTAYSTMGGLKAVIWTDVIQSFVMLLAMGLCFIWVFFSLDITGAEAMRILADEDKLRLFDTRFNLAEPMVYIMALSAFYGAVGGLGDQNYIQRVQATADEKEARKAVVTQLAVAVPLNACLFALGTCLYIFYREHPDMIGPAMKADGIFPLFAAQMLPSGVAGVVVAALMAATMSTFSSAINAVANVAVEDYVRPLKPNLGDRQAVRYGVVFTCLFGVFGTGMSLILANTGLTSVWDLLILISGVLFAPMTGVYFLGLFTKRAGAGAAFVGLVAAMAFTAFIKLNFAFHPFVYMPASITVCVTVGYLASWPLPAGKRDLNGLTVFSLPPAAKQN